jgi:hypothetical protein
MDLTEGAPRRVRPGREPRFAYEHVYWDQTNLIATFVKRRIHRRRTAQYLLTLPSMGLRPILAATLLLTSSVLVDVGSIGCLGDLACGEMCAGGDFSCSERSVAYCPESIGCTLHSTCVCIGASCSPSTIAACSGAHSNMDCARSGFCSWQSDCRGPGGSCFNIRDKAACSAAGCTWERNCD